MCECIIIIIIISIVLLDACVQCLILRSMLFLYNVLYVYNVCIICRLLNCIVVIHSWYMHITLFSYCHYHYYYNRLATKM